MQGFTIVGELQLYWKNFEESFLQSSYSQHYQNLIAPLSNVYSYILEYQVRAICHLSKKQLARAWEKASGKYDWATEEARIVKLSEACNANIQPLQKRESHQRFREKMAKLDQICQVGTDVVETIKDENQRDREEDLMKELAGGAGDYLGGMNFNKDPVKGTCEWFYNGENLSNWLTSEGSGVFWVTAGPGCGKSVLARSLVKHGHLQSTTTTVDIETHPPIQSTEAIICYFFFKDETAERMSISTALCAILHQLFSQDSTNKLIKRVSGPSNRNAQPSPRSFDSLWETLLVVAESHTGGDIICVLDALDECQIEDRDRFVSRLDQFHAEKRSCSTNLRFLITSRPYDDIEMSFMPFLNRTEYFRFDADEHYGEISQDISLVIDDRMESFASTLDEADRQKIADELKSRGTNTYLWLHLTLDIMKRHPSLYSRQRDVEKFLADLPSKVSEAYEKILSRTTCERTTTTLLQIMLSVKEPISVQEANYLLTLALADHDIKTRSELDSEVWKGDFKSIVKNFCGLIVSVYDGILSFIHLTVREFLTKESDSATTRWGGRFADPAPLHEPLARCYMQYLLFSDFACRQPPIVRDIEDEDLLLHDASLRWSEHFQALDELTRSSYLPQARQLCDPSQLPLRTWSSLYLRLHPEWDPNYRSFYDWSDLAVAAFVGLQAVVEDLVENVGVNVNELYGGCGTALHAAVAGNRETIAAYLISKGAEVDKKPSSKRGTPLDIAVARRQHHGIARLLLEKGASPLIKCEEGYDVFNWFSNEVFGLWLHRQPSRTILACAAMLPQNDIFYTMLARLVDISTPDAIVLAAADQRIVESGNECVALVLNRLNDDNFGDKKFLTEGRLKTLFSIPSVGERVLKVVKQQHRQHIIIQKAVLELTVRIQGISAFLRDFLVQTKKPCLYITQEVLETIARHYHPDDLRLFIQASSQDQYSLKTLILPAMENSYAMALVVSEFTKTDVLADEEFQKQVLLRPCRRSVVEAFLQLPRLTTSVKKLLIRSAFNGREYFGAMSDDELLKNELSRNEFLQTVLEHEHCSGIVDSQLLEHAVEVWSVVDVQLLLKHSPGTSLAEERYLIAATGNLDCGKAMTKFILDKYWSDAAITPNVARAAAEGHHKVFEWLLETRPGQIPITADVVSHLSWRNEFEAILQYRRDDLARIACEALHKAANPLDYQDSSIHNLLHCCPVEWFEPTETLILDILEGDDCRPTNQISLLINIFEDKIVITERILAAAVLSHEGKELLDIFKTWEPEHFKITPWIIEKTAAAGRFCDLDYLANISGKALKVEQQTYALARFRQRACNYPWKGYKEAWSEEVDPNAKDAHGRTALHVAALHHGSPLELFCFLLEETYADVHAVDRRGWTPLHCAVYGCKIKVVQMLLAAGADPNKAALNGDTPISLVENDWRIEDRCMDKDTLLLVLKDEWFAGFMDPAFGVDGENPYDEADSDSEDDSTDN